MIHVSVFKQTSNDNTFKSQLSKLDLMPHAPLLGLSLILLSSDKNTPGIITSILTRVEETQDGYIVETENSIYVIHTDKL